MNKKIKNCIKELQNAGLDALLVSDPENISYLTGFRSAEGYLLITGTEQLIYFTFPLYRTEAEREKYWKVKTDRNLFKIVHRAVKQSGLKKLGFEAKNMPYLEYKKLSEDFSQDGIKFRKTVDLVENLRAVKTEEEINLIKKSAAISYTAFEYVREICDKTLSEKDLSIELERFLRIKGDNQIAFPVIIASGKNSSLPHHIPSDTKLNKNLCLIDLGSKYHGYCADLTRVFFWGKIPLSIAKIFDILFKAQEISIKKIKPGVKAGEIDKAARKFIDKQGFGKNFIHGLGHGVGLNVHELPHIAPYNDQILKEGMVVTIEPAIYIRNKLGIRIEDMVLVKEEKGEILNGHLNWRNQTIGDYTL